MLEVMSPKFESLMQLNTPPPTNIECYRLYLGPLHFENIVVFSSYVNAYNVPLRRYANDE